MSEAPRFVPFSDAKSPRVDLHELLPNIVDGNLIEVNLGTIERACQLSGISFLSGVNLAEQPTSGFRVTTVGITTEGYATGAPVINKEALYIVDSNPHSEEGWTGIIRVNTREIGQKVVTDRGDYRSIEGWSKYMNQVLGRALPRLFFKRWLSQPLRPDRQIRACQYLINSEEALVRAKGVL